MPLESPYEYNGLLLGDQAGRDAVGARGSVLPARALERRQVGREVPCIPCMQKKGLRVRALDRIVEGRETRSQRRELRRRLGLDGRAVADGTTGVAHYEAAGLIVIAPGKFFNNGRPAPPTANGVEDAAFLTFGKASGGPHALFDTQQAADYAHALNSTAGLTAADVGAIPAHGYDMLGSYLLAVSPTKTPRIGWHNTSGGDTPGNVNTHVPLAQDGSGVSCGGMHQFGLTSNGNLNVTLWADEIDEIFFRLFCVTAPTGSEGIYLDQIFLFNNYGRNATRYYSGQAVPETLGAPTSPTTTLNRNDALGSDLQHTGLDSPPQDVTADSQQTATPALTETYVVGGDPNMGYTRPAVVPTTLLGGWDQNLLRSQFLISARTTDTDSIFTRGRFGRLAMRLNGGAWVDQVQGNQLDVSYAFWFCPTVMQWQVDSPHTDTDHVDLAAYMPAHTTPDGTVTAGAEVRYEIIAAVRPELDAPPALTGDLGAVKGAADADIDGNVTFHFETTYDMLYDVRLFGRVQADPHFATWFMLDNNVGNVWSTDLVYSALTDVGAYELEVAAFYENRDAPLATAPTETGPWMSARYEAPSDTILAEFSVGESDPPATPVILNCPSGPQATNTVTIEFNAPVTTGFSAPDHFTYSLDGGALVVVAASPFTLVGLTPGTHTVCVESWNAVSEHSAPVCCTFVVESPQAGGVGLAARDGCGVTDLDWGILNAEADDWWIKVLSVDGIWDADVRDERYPRPGRSGEKSFDDFYGGKTITVTAEVRGRNLAGMRKGQRAVQRAFGDLGSHRFYFRSWIDAAQLYVCARKNQPIAMSEAQQDNRYARPFVVTLRADDPRAYSTVEQCVDLIVGEGTLAGTGHWRRYPIATTISLGGTNPLHMRSYNIPGHPNLRDYPDSLTGGDTGTSVAVTNGGTADTYPVTRIYGPVSGPIVLANLTTGEQIVWTDEMIVQDGQFLQIDHGFGEITRNGIAPVDYTGLDVTQTDFWPLDPGVNDVALFAGLLGTGARAQLCWKDAYG